MTFDWKAIVKSLAPTLGAALGGPVGLGAAKLLQTILGASDSEEATLAAAIQSATPEQFLAIKNSEQEFKIKMTELGYKNIADIERIGMEDRNSARNREIAIKDNTPKMLAYGVTSIWAMINFSLLWMAWHHNSVQTEMQVIIGQMMKTIDMALTFILGYYYGTSHGSQAKNEMLYNSSPVGMNKDS